MKGRVFLIRAAVIVVLGGTATAGFLLQKPGTEGETAVWGPVEGTSSAWFCTGLMPREGRTEMVAVSNPGAESLTGRLTISGDGRALKTRSIDVPALDTIAIDIGREITPNRAPAEITNSQSAGVVAVVELDGASAAVNSGTYVATGSITDVAVARCGTSLAQRLTVPGGSSLRGVTTDLYLANPLGHDAVSNVSLITEDGMDDPPKLQRLPVLASSQASYRISDESRRKWVLDVEATATAGEVAGLIEVGSDGTRIGPGLARVPGSTAASAAWMFPAYSGSHGASSMLSISNPIPEHRTVEVRIVPDDSVSPTAQESIRPRVLEVPANSAITLTPSPGLGEGARFGVWVEAPDGRPLSASATLGPQPAARGLGISTGEARGYNRWVLQDPVDLGLGTGARVVVSVMNVGDKDATVGVSAFGSGTVSKPPGLEAVRVARRRAVTLDVSSLQLPPEVRSILIDSDTPVIAEATVATGADPASGGFDVMKVSPMQLASPPGGAVSTAGIGVPGGPSTVVFAVALLSAAALVFLLGRRSARDRSERAATEVAIGEGAVLRIAEARRTATTHPQGDPVRLPTFILFSHEDCRACRAVRELLDTVVQRHGGDVAEVTFESERELFESAGVEDVPTTVLVVQEKIEAIWVGPLEGREIEAALAAVVSSDRHLRSPSGSWRPAPTPPRRF